MKGGRPCLTLEPPLKPELREYLHTPTNVSQTFRAYSTDSVTRPVHTRPKRNAHRHALYSAVEIRLNNNMSRLSMTE